MRCNRKNLLVLVTACVVASAGCSLPGDKAKWGCTFILHKPPVVDTDMPVLIQPPNGTASGTPLGHFAAPLQVAPQIAPYPNTNMLLGTSPVPSVHASGDPCRPHVNGRQMTCEEWCQMFRAVQAQRMPQANQ